MTIFLQSTPIEQHNGIFVKREDLCVVPRYREMFPRFSKLRGVYEHLRMIQSRGYRNIGVLDTVHSQAGWGVAATCSMMGLNCINYHPMRKNEDKIRPYQEKSLELGAELIAMEATKSAVLWHRAKKHLAENYDLAYMMPNGLKLHEAYEVNALEAASTIPECLCKGTWIFSVSTGSIMAGVMKGLNRICDIRNIMFVAHMGYSRSEEGLRNYLVDSSGIFNAGITIIDEGYQYADAVAYPAPFPCNEYYDRKAWKWALENKEMLKTPIVFWNVG